MPTALEQYDAYATITDFNDRERVSRLVARMAEIDAAPSKMAAYRDIGMQEGISAKSMERLYYKWKKDGDAALADGRKLSRPSCAKRFYDDFKTYSDKFLNDDFNAFRQMDMDFRSGVVFSFGTWRDIWREDKPFCAVPAICPANWTPKGWTYNTLHGLQRKDPKRVIARAWAHGGAFAASAHTLPVIRSRVGLKVGQVFQADDVWHNIDVFAPYISGKFQPLEFAIYDVASAFKAVSVMKPRMLTVDAKTGKETRDNLKEQQFRFAMQYLVACKGFHRDGVTFVLERGTTAIRENVQARVAGVPVFGKLVKFCTSGILKDAAHKGLFLGNAGGNPRMKSLCECAHNILHNATAGLLGSRGRDAAHMHESNRAAVKYTEEMLELANRIDANLIPLLQLPKLRYEDYTRYFYTIEDFVMDRTEHNLEGWAENFIEEYRLTADQDSWLPVSKLADMSPLAYSAITAQINTDKDNLMRQRKLSRREVWARGQSELIRWPIFDLPAWADPRDMREATVGRDYTISYTDSFYFPGHKQIYVAEYADRRGLRTALCPGEKVRFFWNPIGPLANQIWIADPKGAVLGVCPILKTAAWADPDSIQVAIGQKLAYTAEMMADTHARHIDAAAERLVAEKINRLVLEAGKEAKQPVPVASDDAIDALELLNTHDFSGEVAAEKSQTADALEFLNA